MAITKPGGGKYKSDKELREELQALLSARSELGTEFDEEFAELFLERLNAYIDRRVEERGQALGRRGGANPHAVGMVAVAMVFGIPASAIAGSFAGLMGIVIVWATILIVSLAASGRRLSEFF